MKIAIYGDSYTFPKDRKSKSWIQHLSTLGYDIDNFGENGSSCYFSYNKFLTTHKGYDKIIFLATNHGRFWLKENADIRWQHCTNIDTCMSFLKSSKVPYEDKLRIKAVRNWMIYVMDLPQEEAYQTLMLADILKKRPDTIMIPCFWPTASFVPDWEGPCLYDISKIDIDYFNLKKEQYNYPGTDLRHCHISDDNNIILGNKINEYIKSGTKDKFRINLTDYVNPTVSVENYFTWPGLPNFRWFQ